MKKEQWILAVLGAALCVSLGACKSKNNIWESGDKAESQVAAAADSQAGTGTGAGGQTGSGALADGQNESGSGTTTASQSENGAGNQLGDESGARPGNQPESGSASQSETGEGGQAGTGTGAQTENGTNGQPQSGTSGASGNKADDPAGTGTLTVRVASSIGDLNPHTPEGLSFAKEWVYENLTALENGEVVPELAERWEISEDGLTYTFHLRENVTFIDGTVFNSEIARKNIDAVLLHREYYPYLPSLSAIQAVEATEPYTLTITLSRPSNSLLTDFAGSYPVAMLGAAGFPDTGDTYYSGITEPVGTGMWVLLESGENGEALFERNENYWGEKPYFKFLKTVVVPDIDEAVESMKEGNIDLIADMEQLAPETLEAMKESGLGTASAETSSILCLSLNTAGPVTGDENVRLAMEYAVDKEAVSETVFGGLCKTADFYFSKKIPRTNIGIEPYSYDLAKANQILDEAGWVYPEGESVRMKGENRLEVNMLYDASSAANDKVCQLLKEQYAMAGIQINLLPMDREGYNQGWQSGEFGAVLSRTWGDPYEPYGTFACMVNPGDKFSVVQSGMKSKAELNVILYDALSQNDEKRLQEDFDFIMDSFHDEAVYVPLTVVNMSAVYNGEYTAPDLDSGRGGLGIFSMKPALRNAG